MSDKPWLVASYHCNVFLATKASSVVTSSLIRRPFTSHPTSSQMLRQSISSLHCVGILMCSCLNLSKCILINQNSFMLLIPRPLNQTAVCFRSNPVRQTERPRPSFVTVWILKWLMKANWRWSRCSCTLVSKNEVNKMCLSSESQWGSGEVLRTTALGKCSKEQRPIPVCVTLG